MRGPIIKRARSIQEVRGAFDQIASTTAGDTRFMAQCSLYIAERLASIEGKLDALSVERTRRPKRRPTEWNRFFARGMKAGKTPAQIGAEWRERKA